MSFTSFLNYAKVSSTYLFHKIGLTGAEFKASSSKNYMYKLATTAETGPMAAPSTCSQQFPLYLK